MSDEARERVEVVIANTLSATQYRALLDVALQFCTRALLVVRLETDLSHDGQMVLRALEPFDLRQEVADEWPGTRLLDSVAQLNHFRYDFGSVEALSNVAETLDEWAQPELPEDLCIFREDGSVWLASVADESDFELDLTQDEVDAVIRGVPGIDLVPRDP